ncbi:MAG: hypothetical protein J6039_02310 [Alphaproteobacteria bacterium]|nr:hypothetical protein [Alphaproteobacteria bacterium]
MTEFTAKEITKENLSEFKKWLSGKDGKLPELKDVVISAGLAYSEFASCENLTLEQKKVIYAMMVKDILTKSKNNLEKCQAIYNESVSAKEPKKKEAKIKELAKLLRLDEFMQLDMVPDVSLPAMESLANNGLRDVCQELIVNRPLNENLKVLQYWYVPDIERPASAQLSKEERDDLGKLFALYKKENGSEKNSRENINGNNNMHRILSRGILLSCESLSKEERKIAIMECYGQYWLKYFQEKDFDKEKIMKMLSHPEGYLSKEARDVMIDENKGHKLADTGSEEIEKFSKVVLSLVGKSAFDKESYGRVKHCNEQLCEILHDLSSENNGGYGMKDFYYLYAVWRNLYIKTAETDIMAGHASELSPQALGHVLSNDRNGYFARLITPEDLEKAAKNDYDEWAKYAVFDGMDNDVRKRHERSLFIINRKVPKKPEELLEAFKGDMFKALTPKECDYMLWLAEFNAKLDLLHPEEKARKEALEAFETAWSGKEGAEVSHEAWKITYEWESLYTAEKAKMLKRLEYQGAVDAVDRACMKDAEMKKRAFKFISDLQEAYGAIVVTTKGGRPRDREEFLSKENVEKIIAEVINGQHRALGTPSEGRLPLFGKEKEENRRKSLYKNIEKFNKLLDSLAGDSAIKKEFQDSASGAMLDFLTYDRAEHKTKEAEKVSTEVKKRIKEDSFDILYRGAQDKFRDIMKYKPEHMELVFVPMTEYDEYKILQEDEQKMKTIDEAKKQYDEYRGAVKEVAKERLGNMKERVEMPEIVKGQGKETHDQRAAWKAKDKTLADPLDKPLKSMANEENKNKIRDSIRARTQEL